jgi:phospholipid/cholesterol/gamma-HCH transport system ATP-binding protein
MIEFRDVTKSFEDETVLKSVSFRISRGETKIILGVSGSGKSTILKLILGLIRPEEGQIFVEGSEITQLPERELVPIRGKIGMVFQEGALFDSLNVRENVGYRLFEEGKMEESQIDAVVRRLLGFVDLEESIDKMPAELSGGMKRRVSIARALVGNPKVILYDEPTAGLDPITKSTIVELMIKLRDVEGVTSVFVTHDLQAASTMATKHAVSADGGSIQLCSGEESPCLRNTRFIMLQDGAVGFEGSYREMMSSKIPYVQAFVS